MHQGMSEGFRFYLTVSSHQDAQLRGCGHLLPQGRQPEPRAGLHRAGQAGGCGAGGLGAGLAGVLGRLCSWDVAAGPSLLRYVPITRPRASAAPPLPQLEAEASGQQVEAQQRALRFDAGYSLLGTAVNAPAQEADAAERREWLLLAAAALKAAGADLAAQQVTAALGPLASRAAVAGGGRAGAAARR